MNEAQMTRGRDWAGNDASGWFATEKFDGCRAYWDGLSLWTRGGNVISARADFLKAMPPIHMDCELWAGRGSFKAARLATQFGKWQPDIRLIIHDMPRVAGNYLQRMSAAPFVAGICEPAPVVLIESNKDLWRIFSEVKSKNGEGLMIRSPRITAYERARTYSLLKIKEYSQFRDCEFLTN